DAENGQGCALILDRPTGVVDGNDSTGITLCHSGWGLFGKSVRPDVKGIDGERHSDGKVYGVQEYDISLLPYTPEAGAAAVCAYQDQAYPLQISAETFGALPIPAITIDGHSIVSNLSREEDGIVLRLWNPLADETLSLKAPGMHLIMVDLEGNELEDLGRDEAQFPIKAMQIKSILLQSQTRYHDKSETFPPVDNKER
ncbi:MAG: hypothetical protein QF828_02305, partial [Pseudomonadales bacterium]|nr:hypothetical protein [Pseudomonadales bacterium]